MSIPLDPLSSVLLMIDSYLFLAIAMAYYYEILKPEYEESRKGGDHHKWNNYLSKQQLF